MGVSSYSKDVLEDLLLELTRGATISKRIG